MKARLMDRLADLLRGLGAPGVAALALIALAAGFSSLAVKPLEQRAAALQGALQRAAPAPGGAAADQAEALYRRLGSNEDSTDALARLHAIGTATGVQLLSASYRSHKEGRVERFEIVLPVAGSYSQIRDFLSRTLAELPALSLDQVSLKRESRADTRVQAELRLTLHKVST